MSATYIRDNLKNGRIVYGNEFYKDGMLCYPYHHPVLYGDGLRNFKMRESDIFLSSYQRSGTILALHLVQLVHNGGETEAMRNNHIHFRPGTICSIIGPQVLKGELDPLDYGPDPIPEYNEVPSPRYLWGHTPYEFVPNDCKKGKCKVIVNWRNPKSMYTSLFHHTQGFSGILLPEGGFSWQDWMAAVLSADSKNMLSGTWFDFNLQWWKHRENMEIYFLQYERIVKECPKVISELADFLGNSLTNEQITSIARLVSFNEFKRNPSTGGALDKMNVIKSDAAPHIRKGKLDDWKGHFTVAENEAFDRLYEDKMAGSDFPTCIYE